MRGEIARVWSGGRDAGEISQNVAIEGWWRWLKYGLKQRCIVREERGKDKFRKISLQMPGRSVDGKSLLLFVGTHIVVMS
jgi:hypothetical protein